MFSYKIEELMEKYEFDSILSTRKINFIHIPVNRLPSTPQGAEIFNEFFRTIEDDELTDKIVRTPSGGISIKNRNLKFPSYDIQIQKTAKGKFSGIEITVLLNHAFRIQFAGKPEEVVSGSTAFKEFRRIFKKFGVDLNEYAVDKEEGKQLKAEIVSPLICLQNKKYKDQTLTNVHHLDWNSSFATGLVNNHPEFKDPIEYMYEHRKDIINGKKDWYKGVLNAAIGYMQSPYSQYKYTALSRDAINDNHSRICDLAIRLVNAGNDVISFNTDGIWYQGEIYHDENEGTHLGQWKNDHINCTFRAKSDGAYEFIEDGKYHPVVRGRTKYDMIKHRDDWEWGDIYRDDCNPIIYWFDEEKGVMYGTIK